MAGVNVKMGVDVSQFKQGISEAASSVKTLDAQLKLNEKQLKANGDAELYMSNKSQLLNKQLEAQRSVVSGLQKSLNEMEANGVNPSSEAYQKLERSLANAAGKMMDIQAELNGLSSSEQKAGDGAQQVAQNLSSINKKVSFDAVIKGIDSITSGLENAAKKALHLGQSIFDSLMDSAKWADDTKTMAQMYEIPLDTYLRMEALVATGMDTSVDSIIGSMSKLKKNVGSGSKTTMDALKELGLAFTEYGGKTAEGVERLVTEDAEEMFWEAGKAIMAMTDAFDKEAAAQAIFGRSWRELIPLFTEFQDKESFNAALEAMNVNSEDAVNDLADLNDAMGDLQHNFDVLKNEVMAGLAPALKDAANALSGLLQNVMEYLKTPEGKKALQDMSDAVSGLFEDLGKIDPAKVVEGFSSVFNTIIGGLQWMVENKGTLEGILVAIVTAWGAAKLTGGALQVLQLVNGIKGLGGAKGVNDAVNQIANNGGGGGAGAAGAGAAKTGIFAKAGAALKAGFAANGLWALTPAAVAAVGLAPGIALDKKLEEQYVNQYNKSNEVISEAEQNDKVDKALIRIAKATTEAILPSGTGTNAFGFINLNNTDAINKAIGTFGIKSYENMWKDLFAQYYEYDNIHGWSIDAMIKRARGEAVTDSMGMHEIVPMDDQDRSALAEAMNKVLIRALEDEYQYDPYALSRSKNGIQRRELPSGWAYDESGDVYNISTGKYLGGGNGYGQWAYWDDARYQKWFDEENAKYAEENQALQESANKISDAADKMGGMPEAVAAAVSGVTLNVQVALGGMYAKGHANGIWSVPWDGYPAILHRNERVIPARQASQYNSNIYFGNVNLNNGLEIEALTESIDRRNRRQQAGYGAA